MNLADNSSQTSTYNKLNNVKSLIAQQKTTLLVRPCIINDGIISLKDQTWKSYYEIFVKKCNTIGFFIPASGAASRMFQHIIEGNHHSKLLIEFANHWHEFPFSERLEDKKQLENLFLIPDPLIRKAQITQLLPFINLPKALVPFHRYNNGSCYTALQEQLNEIHQFCSDISEHPVQVHFTVPQNFEEEINECIKRNELKYNPHVSFETSIQDPETDLPALLANGDLALDQNQKPIFRPAGHGALIQNLQMQHADLIFIKNIDNIGRIEIHEKVNFYRKAMGGFLLELLNQVRYIINQLNQNPQNTDLIDNALEFTKEFFGKECKTENKIDWILNTLNAPCRVCAMVKNTGEPGGGPFWTIDQNHNTTKQIVEKNQINLNDQAQSGALDSSTHFNPVDMVCSIKDIHGNTFDLTDFIDTTAVFTSQKFTSGKNVTAVELPGLWNGSMANWNTVFIEIPNDIFLPVKTINDLIKPGHRQVS
jgi:hypothetical protein